MSGNWADPVEFAKDALRLEPTFLQRVFLRFAARWPLSFRERRAFRRHAGRAYRPGKEIPFEICFILGRQCGKSSVLAATLALHTVFNPSTVANLQIGENFDVCVVSPTRRQSGVIQTKVRGLVENNPQLLRELDGEPTKDQLTFKNGCRVSIFPANASSVRGFRPALLLLDEACFFAFEGTRSDSEIIGALRPGMSHVENARIVAVSTPWVKDGRAWELYSRRSDPASATVFQAASWEVLPSFPKAALEREMAEDPEAFRREFGAEFSASIEQFLPSASLEACVSRGIDHRPPLKSRTYAAAVDQGYRKDRFTLVIGHAEDEEIVIDRLHDWKPRSGHPVRLESMLPELKGLLVPYGVTRVLGDQYSSDAFEELLRREGLVYLRRPFTRESKEAIFSELKYAVIGERVRLLDHKESLRELRMLEARRLPSGGMKIEAPSAGSVNDDYADALALLVSELATDARRGDGVDVGHEYGEQQSLSVQDRRWTALQAGEKDWQTGDFLRPDIYQN